MWNLHYIFNVINQSLIQRTNIHQNREKKSTGETLGGNCRTVGLPSKQQAGDFRRLYKEKVPDCCFRTLPTFILHVTETF